MDQFKSNKINIERERLGEQLRIARENQKIKLGEASQKLNIDQKYLEALENGQLSRLPQGIYGKSFLREYALFLKINPDELLASYNKEINESRQIQKNDPFSKKVIGAQYFLTIPKIIKNSIIVTILIICIGYLGYYLNNIVAPPALVISAPADSLVTDQHSITVKGKTEPETEITINEEAVLIDNNGDFSKDLYLKNGLNTITIQAKKKYSRNHIIVRNVLVNE